MDAGMLAALGYIVVAGVMNGAYTLPMKFTPRWKWENTWLAFTVLGECIVPVALALITIPNIFSLYAAGGAGILIKILIFGFAWGVSMILFGRAVDTIGVAITFAVSLSTSAAAGSLTPLLVNSPGRLLSNEGMMILLALVLTAVGVTLVARAGKQREKDQTKSDSTSSVFLRGFIFALLSGVCGSMLNFAVAFGSPLIEAAAKNGASPAMVTNVVWAPAVIAGAIPGVIFCLLQVKKNKTASNFLVSGTSHYWALAFLMGVLWFGSVVLYGIAVLRIGQLGAVFGWPLFMVAIVLASAGWGALTGEWKESSAKARTTMAAGIAVLLLTIVVLAGANMFGSKSDATAESSQSQSLS